MTAKIKSPTSLTVWFDSNRIEHVTQSAAQAACEIIAFEEAELGFTDGDYHFQTIPAVDLITWLHDNKELVLALYARHDSDDAAIRKEFFNANKLSQPEMRNPLL